MFRVIGDDRIHAKACHFKQVVSFVNSPHIDLFATFVQALHQILTNVAMVRVKRVVAVATAETATVKRTGETRQAKQTRLYFWFGFS